MKGRNLKNLDKTRAGVNALFGTCLADIRRKIRYIPNAKELKGLRKIHPDKLEPGMILAKPILIGSAVFLGEGVVLTERLVSRIQNMNLDYAFVEGRSEQDMPLEEALALLDHRFRNCDGSDLMMNIKEIVRKHIIELYE